MGLRNLPGGVPEPDELIGRDHLIHVLWEQLAGNNILLVAPRRFGKTGIMRHVLKRPRTGYLPVYLEVEDASTPEMFAAELLSAVLAQGRLRKLLDSAKRLPRKAIDFVTQYVDEIGTDEFKIKLGGQLGESWASVSKRLILEMEKAKESVVFIIDEFPNLVHNVASTCGDEQAGKLLAWFRSLRMRQKDELRRFRFILGGSTSIDIVLRRLGLTDKLNDFFRLPVEPLDREHAETILHGLAEEGHLQFTAEAIEAIFEVIGPPVPYFLHLLVSQLILEEALRGRPLSRDDIAAVYRKRVLGPTCRGYFDYYRRRLERYGEGRERAAIAILKAIAEAPAGRVADGSLYDVYRKARRKGACELDYREVLADLECDWYVVLDTATNEYSFMLRIMRDWWKRFYGSVGGPRGARRKP